MRRDNAETVRVIIKTNVEGQGDKTKEKVDRCNSVP